MKVDLAKRHIYLGERAKNAVLALLLIALAVGPVIYPAHGGLIVAVLTTLAGVFGVQVMPHAEDRSSAAAAPEETEEPLEQTR